MNSLNILIVEDETITAADIQETLEKAGHSIITIARNTQEAVAAVKKYLPDLAMIDISLERSSADGIDTARELLSHHRMPIIYLTAHSEAQTFQRARETMPAAYLLKPFRQHELAFQVELAYMNQHTKNLQTSETLLLPINKGYEKIHKDKVIYLLAEGAYVKVYMAGEEKPYLLAMNLGYLAQYFSTANFHRLSRSLLINLDHVSRLERSQLFMHNYTIPINIPEGNRGDLMKKLAVVRTR
ncbi:response regulator [Spirosoma sp. HMF4905]|uniref:Response regulator n=1 Tax=Spirosoma arboris TaxID=2682092 RepID=A0A7K1SFY1_9BACT|nr:response regulator [Spirosoma arboris]MVM32725.1 response regulator [Spirosoma arboris]